MKPTKITVHIERGKKIEIEGYATVHYRKGDELSESLIDAIMDIIHTYLTS